VELPLSRRGVPAGTVEIVMEGSCAQLRATMKDPGDGLYRAVLVGEKGERLLGVMEPSQGELTLCRRIYDRDIRALGALKRGEARRSIAFSPQQRWQAVEDPARLFGDPFWQQRLKDCGKSWFRREGELLYLALPLEGGKPFPLVTLFCLARREDIAGQCCVRYAFDENEQPVNKK